jgi:hypothetical protein
MKNPLGLLKISIDPDENTFETEAAAGGRACIKDL